MENIVVYCADVGSIKSDNFGWARGTIEEGILEERGKDYTDIDALVNDVADDLNDGRKVALGFECPLYVPTRDEPENLTSQRKVEEGAGRPWSARAGAAVLGVGLVEAVYVLRELRNRLAEEVPAFLNSGNFEDVESGVLLWEAMVTGDAKSDSGETEHIEDAHTAVKEFLETYPDLELYEDAGTEDRSGVHSLIGSVLLRTGWTGNLGVLSKPCPFVRLNPPG